MSRPQEFEILVVEDNADLSKALVDNLLLEGYRVSAVADGNDAVEQIAIRDPDLVLLDIMLPGRDGYAVLRAARAAAYTGLILMLTARGEESDKVRGLQSGADDYVTKPFGLLELLARVAALLRRASRIEATAQRYQFGPIMVDSERRLALHEGVDAALTPKEFDLLLALLKRNGAVCRREQLLAEVWGHSGAVETRTVDTHIAELRRKLEPDPAHPLHILTARKVGYRLQR